MVFGDSGFALFYAVAHCSFCMEVRVKIRFWTVVFLCGLLGLQAGCGSREKSECRKEPESSNRQEDKEGQNTEGQDTEGEQTVSIKQMELLQFEDSGNENLADLLQRAGGGMMVQLRAGGLLGSGVICGTEEDRLLILTAAHVLEKAEDAVEVIFADGECVSADQFECSEMGDFAVVQVTAGDIPEDTLAQCLCANLDKESFDAAVSGQGCIVMGSRSGVAAEAYEGVILDHWIYMEDYGQYMMWVRAEGKPGMSGGGLFDRQGHFLGIISGGSEDGELAVVPLSLMLAEVELLQTDGNSSATP